MPDIKLGNSNIDRWSIALFLAAILSHLPLGYEYVIRMWNSGHYQFFPLLILVVGYLFARQLPAIVRQRVSPTRWILSGLLLLDLMLVFFATLWETSFVWALSAFLLLNISLYFLYGFGGWKRSVPIMALLLFVIPIPLGIDEKIIFQMQFLASHLASWILDGLGQIHFRSGVVLYTEVNSYLTEEACSGVRSMYSSLAAVMVIGVFQSYSLWRNLFNFVQTIFWVVVGNALRVAIVVYGSERWTESLASGPLHEFLGLCVFLFVVLMAVSTDHFFNVLKSMITAKNVIVIEPSTSPKELQKQNPKKSKVAIVNCNVPRMSLAMIPFFLLIFVVGIRLVAFSSGGAHIGSIPRITFPEGSELANELSSWRQNGEFEHLPRGESRLRAADSFVWKFSNGELNAIISLDCPWDDWHDLSICYRGLGWNTESTNQFSDTDKEGLPASELGYTQMKMHKLNGESGMVIFSSVDRNGNEVVPKFRSGFLSFDSVRRKLSETINRMIGQNPGPDQAISDIELPVSAIQLYCEHGNELTPEQIDELQNLFFAAREQLVRSRRFKEND